jgi:hypothetical protein
MKILSQSKTILFITLLTLSMTLSLSYGQQTRGVDWIHGLGGDVNSLRRVDSLYNALRRVVTPIRQGYNTSNGITNMATAVQGSTGGANRLGIGHSLGGTAARQVSFWNNAHWRGIVTMGSPLRGGKISASASDGTNTAFINNGIDRMMAGPGVGAGTAPPIFPNLGILIHQVSILGQLFSGTLASKANSTLMNSFGLVGQTAVDLHPNSNYQSGVQFQGATVPKILIWGNEVYPLLWRTVGTYSSDNGTDDQGVNIASTAADIYNTIANGEEALSWANLPMHGFHQWRKGKWEEGKNWVNNDSNAGWEEVIGSNYTELVSWYETVVTCDANQWQACYASSPPPGYCDDYCTDQVYHSYTVYHDYPSDGVVTQRSAINDGGSWQGIHLEAPNTNHGEFKRPDRVRPTLDWVFNNGDQSGHFQIDLR